jgi:hypothetical protein
MWRSGRPVPGLDQRTTLYAASIHARGWLLISPGNIASAAGTSTRFLGHRKRVNGSVACACYCVASFSEASDRLRGDRQRT